VKSPVGADQFSDLLQKTNAPQESFNDTPSTSLGTLFSPTSDRRLFSTPLSSNKKEKVIKKSGTPLKRTRNPPERWVPY
jgi:hypothetical protein